MRTSLLKSILEICDIHVARIEYALSKIRKYFPVKAECLKIFTQDELAYFELYINRFGKLQDYIGARLILEILKNSQTEVGLTLIDKIHQLQKMGIIINVEDWFELRDIRNHAAHEYPDQPQLVAQHLNKLYDSTAKLFAIYAQLKSFAEGLIRLEEKK